MMKHTDLHTLISTESELHKQELHKYINPVLSTDWVSNSVFLCDHSSKITKTNQQKIKDAVLDGALLIYFHYTKKKIPKHIKDIIKISTKNLCESNVKIKPTENHSTILNEIDKVSQCKFAHTLILENNSMPLLNSEDRPVAILKQLGRGQILAYFIDLDYELYPQIIKNTIDYSVIFKQKSNFKEIILGTSNEQMANELRPFLDQINIKIERTKLDTSKIERFNTYAENALAKARAYFNQFNKPVLTQDSGVSIACLDDKPGVETKKTKVDEMFLSNIKDKSNRNARIDQFQLFYWRHESNNGHSKEMYFFQYSKIPVKVANYIKGNSSHPFDNILLIDNNKFLSEVSLSEKFKIQNRELGIRNIIQFIEYQNQNFVCHNKSTNKDIFLCGDFNYDQLIFDASTKTENVGSHFERYISYKVKTSPISRYGGVFLLKDLIEFYDKQENININQPVKLSDIKKQTEQYLEDNEMPLKHIRRYNHQIFNIKEYQKLPTEFEKVHRIKNLITSYEIFVDAETIEEQIANKSEKESNLVITEFGLDNLKDPYQLLIELNKKDTFKNLFLKTNRPLKFVEAILSSNKERLQYCKNVFIVCNSDNIFYPTPSKISFRSWEQLVEKIIFEFSNLNFSEQENTNYWFFILCRNEGCLLIKPTNSQFQITAYLDSNFIYGELSDPNYGWVSEFQGVFYAKLISEIVSNSQNSIDINLLAMECWKQSRGLYINGFNTINKSNKYNIINTLNSIEKTVKSDKYINGFSSLYLSYCNDSSGEKGFVYNSKLNKSLEFFENCTAGINNNQVLELSFQIISNGISILDRKLNIDGRDFRLYKLKIGKLVTFRRKDIEKLSYLSKLIRDYSFRQEVFRPLSISVFGQPGSGKSFIVKQIIQNLKLDVKFIECNLTQIDSIDDLSLVFHQIQQASIDDKLPVVFWDEFDTSKKEVLGWLKYFLAPMQDGFIKIKEKSYFFKRSIFVFAGGTAYTFKEFENKTKEEEARKNKAPDFISRIKASYDVEGINYIEHNKDAIDNHSKVIKRSQIIRHLLNLHIPHLKTVSKDLIIKLLLYNYKSGIRSLESIIESSTFNEDTHLSFNCLPDEEQLNNYIEGITDVFDFEKDNVDYLQLFS